MGRLTVAGAVLFVALGSALALPVAAQAATSAPAASISAGRQVASPAIEPGSEWEFSGLTYPDTTAGLAACHAEGVYFHESVPSQNLAYECLLNDPDSGVYNLWILFESA
jgi:hypothetical protein